MHLNFQFYEQCNSKVSNNQPSTNLGSLTGYCRRSTRPPRHTQSPSCSAPSAPPPPFQGVAAPRQTPAGQPARMPNHRSLVLLLWGPQGSPQASLGGGSNGARMARSSSSRRTAAAGAAAPPKSATGGASRQPTGRRHGNSRPVSGNNRRRSISRPAERRRHPVTLTGRIDIVPGRRLACPESIPRSPVDDAPPQSPGL